MGRFCGYFKRLLYVYCFRRLDTWIPCSNNFYSYFYCKLRSLCKSLCEHLDIVLIVLEYNYYNNTNTGYTLPKFVIPYNNIVY